MSSVLFIASLSLSCPSIVYVAYCARWCQGSVSRRATHNTWKQHTGVSVIENRMRTVCACCLCHAATSKLRVGVAKSRAARTPKGGLTCTAATRQPLRNQYKIQTTNSGRRLCRELTRHPWRRPSSDSDRQNRSPKVGPNRCVPSQTATHRRYRP